MTRWKVEPPDSTGNLVNDACRIIEVDDKDRFQRVIAKLHPTISPNSAAFFTCVVEMYSALKEVADAATTRDKPEDDEEPYHNDLLLDYIEEEVMKVIRMIEERQDEINDAG